MARRVSKNHVTAADATAAFLSRDVIANILVHLPASVLRRFCIACKEWRDIICDPIFIKSHMIQGSRAPTHTIVFVPSSPDRTGRGFLFDERWRLTARFTVGRHELMIGTCNGLLCFHDHLQGIIKIIEPFTGEAFALPATTSYMNRYSYCFGFDATAGQYKIMQKHYVEDHGICTVNLLTIGEDKDWRTVSTASYASYSYSDAACDGGFVYWNYNEYDTGIPMYARLDLATEEIMSVECRLVDRGPVVCRHPWWPQGQEYAIGIKWLIDELEDDHWPRNMNAMAYHVDAVHVPHGRRLPMPHALQRGHLLLQEQNRALYAHKIVNKSINGLDMECEKLLIGIGMEEEPAKSSSRSSGQFVAVRGRQRSRAQQSATDPYVGISTFAYFPTVCSAPLALHFGTTMH